MNESSLSQLGDIVDILPVEKATENSKQIHFSFSLDKKGKKDLENLLQTSTVTSEFIQTFSIQSHYKGDSPPIDLVRLRGGELQIPSIDSNRREGEEGTWFQEFKKAASFHSSNNEFEQLAEEILSIETPDSNKNLVNFRLEKKAIVEKLSRNSDYDNSKQKFSVWSTKQQLKNWITNTRVSDIINEIFHEDKIPIFIILKHNAEQLPSSQLLKMQYLEGLSALSNDIEEEDWKEYKKCMMK